MFIAAYILMLEVLRRALLSMPSVSLSPDYQRGFTESTLDKGPRHKIVHKCLSEVSAETTV